MTKVAICCSTIPERHNLLIRSIQTWLASAKEAQVDCVIGVYREGYTGNEAWPKAMNVWHFDSPNRTGSPEVGSNFLWNKFKDDVDVIIWTHPEIMFPTDAVRRMVESSTDKVYVTCRVFWMPEYLTKHYDDYGFDKPEDMEACDDLYQYGPDPNGPTRYLNLNIRGNLDWESDTTWSGNVKTLSEIFPLPEFGAWGPIDPYLYGCRKRLGHKKVIPESCVYHQDHPRIQGGPPGYAVSEATKALHEKFGG